MSQAMASCAFVMRRSPRADFASEYVSTVGLERLLLAADLCHVIRRS
jgi:hypothetical protein